MKNQTAIAFVTLLACGAAIGQSPEPYRLEHSDIKTIDSAPRLVGARTEVAHVDTSGPTERPADAMQMDVRRMLAGASTGLGRGRVHFDEPGDGFTWARGDTYKASFGRDGATYIPFLGSDAPRNFPVAFDIESLSAGGEPIAFDADVAPSRADNRVVFDRGSVLEIYDLTPGSIEQSFEFRSQRTGEIVVELAVDTELARTRDGADLVLSGELGSVRYSAAFAVDARIGRTALASEWNGEAIRIAVPAERVAQSAWPLVVDPVISTFAVDLNNPADSLPDIAWDEGTGNWLAVYEQVFSATDHDIYFQMGDEFGPLPEFGYVDMSTIYWAAPKVANMNFTGRFLVVAAVGSPTGGARDIYSRIRSPTLSASFEAAVQVNSPSSQGDEHDPDVGGNPNDPAGGHFCVVWQRDYTSTDHDILAALMNPSGSPAGGVIFLSNTSGTQDNLPAISKSCGLSTGLDDQVWSVGWQRLAGTLDNDVMVAQLSDQGAIVLTPHYVDNSSANTGSVSVSSPTSDSSRKFMVACTYQPNGFTGNDTYGYVVSGNSLVDSGSLTAMSGAPVGQLQLSPSVDCDGSVFVVADQEAVTGGLSYNTYISTFHVIGSVLTLGEGHRLLGGSSTSEGTPEVHCLASSGGPARQTLAIWHDLTGNGNGDIEAAYYDASPFAQFCDPGTDGVIGCPCGNMPGAPNRGCNNSSNSGGAQLTATGTVSPDTVQLTASAMQPTATCLFVQGSLFNTVGLSFGDGVRCVAGNFLRLKTKTASGGTAVYPGSGDPSITQRAASVGSPISAGQDRYYFVYYRDLGVSGCVTTFNTTNSVRIRW